MIERYYILDNYSYIELLKQIKDREHKGEQQCSDIMAEIDSYGKEKFYVNMRAIIKEM
jgi:hypothetical protein